MPKIEGQLRAQLVKTLPVAINKAVTSYEEFVGSEALEDSKDFKAHHDACKVAIAHIELLIRLAGWVDLPDGDILRQESFAELMKEVSEADAEIQGYENNKKE